LRLLKHIVPLLLFVVINFFSWPPQIGGPLIFVAFVPLLFYVENLKAISSKLMRYALAFTGIASSLLLSGYFINNAAWGDYETSVYSGLIVTYIPIALLSSFAVFFKLPLRSTFYFVFAYTTAELVQLHWELNSPLMMLGNSLSNYPELIQHYAIWGVPGGTLYILAINAFLFLGLLSYKSSKAFKFKPVITALVFSPVIISVILFSSGEASGKQKEVGLALAHFEHFTPEFAASPLQLAKRYNALKSSSKKVPEMIIMPESAIVEGGWIENLNRNDAVQLFDSLFPGKEIVFGSHLFSIENSNVNSFDVRYDERSKVRYRSHNCIVTRNTSGFYSLRSKSKFVPFHETIPYPSLLSGFSKRLTAHYVPTYLSEYTHSRKEPFRAADKTQFRALMCFESYFSTMVSSPDPYDFTLILSNESWNDQKNGKIQYFSYMIPKAIESGMPLVKVANCGISGVISPKGRIVHQIEPNRSGLFVLKINLNGKPSIYSMIGSTIHMMIVVGFFASLFFKFDKHEKSSI
jgi:apolipoprotein N-acyltransferase